MMLSPILVFVLLLNPAVASTCTDTILRFKVNWNEKKIMRGCSWVGNKATVQRCNVPGVSAACPVTCGSCSTCKDTSLRFKVGWNGKLIMRDCSWIRNKATIQRCNIPGAAEACPITCGIPCPSAVPSPAPSPFPTARPSTSPSRPPSPQPSPFPTTTLTASNSTLGYGIYLPGENVKQPQAATHELFTGTSDCADEEDYQVSFNEFIEYDSTSDFISEVASDSGIDGSYKNAELSMTGTFSVTTGTTISESTTMHSIALKISSASKLVTFKDSCKSNVDQLVPDIRSEFESLPLPSTTENGNLPDSTWAPYITFMKNHGSHIIKSNVLGSAFYQWESSTSTETDIAHTMKVKACIDVEGVNPEDVAKWNITACEGYSQSDRDKAKTYSFHDLRVILGGNNDTRTALQNHHTQENLDNFINSAHESDQTISSAYEEIWNVLQGIYLPLCEKSYPGACDNVQRARLLEAAYTGKLGYSCNFMQNGRQTVYQAMKYTDKDAYGLYNIQCWAKKTGCESNDDCHIGGGGSVCYAYGTGAFDQETIEGTNPVQYKTVIRGNEQGSYSSGINNSCYYHFGVYCNCHHDWSGGQPNRHIWISGE